MTFDEMKEIYYSNEMYQPINTDSVDIRKSWEEKNKTNELSGCGVVCKMTLDKIEDIQNEIEDVKKMYAWHVKDVNGGFAKRSINDLIRGTTQEPLRPTASAEAGVQNHIKQHLVDIPVKIETMAVGPIPKLVEEVSNLRKEVEELRSKLQ